MDFIVKWTNDIFNCSCKDNPYCDCGRVNLEKLILNLRVKDDMLIEEISNYLNNEYKIKIHKGDIIGYLESLIYSLESIKNIGDGLPNLDAKIKQEILEIPKLITRIKY
ncbi:hypothetical protein LCGC14_0947700 [marine sediment metagenome]|uniref:Uncharacterized protein n=1 Tax=marine sediment metagenome TaxID=412755 RepID=A0A0F9NIB9_9ZZZZ